MISPQLRQQVCQRATSAASEQEIGGIIFKTIADQGADWRQVGREGVKELLVHAIRAFRRSRQEDTLRCAV